mmetsp:Transcript_23580/g.33784  ORF Transcript_23580/g.33784 Transcript_23580/m.33784 type:complete len:375 (+) Transcript_23580:2-1126(+)
MDPAAYKMHLALQGEWPSLSFDFVQDTWGQGRTRFPHQMLAVVGTQADLPQNNSLQVWKLSDLGRLDKDDDENDDNQDYDSTDGDHSDSESDIDYDPVFENSHVNHHGGINRVRNHQGIIATWSDTGKVTLYTMDVEGMCTDNLRAPEHLFTYGGHSSEGYAMDFSTKGILATGDNNGAIHVFESDYKKAQLMFTADKPIEDLQWSPNESTVLAAGETGGFAKIYDVRAPNRAMLTKDLGNKSDINALAWSNLVTNLLGSGCDDGTWSVWDLRKFEEPLARFTSHTTPITSMEWHPTDESMLVVSDDVGSFVYDLSVEEEETQKQNEESDLPPQLLFVHSGSPMTKEVHWHPQITSCLMSTAYDGFHVFIPSNL